MDKRTEFPALEARKSDLEQMHREARQQINDAVHEGKPDGALMQWLAVIRAELDELSYVLKALSAPSSRVDITGRTLLIAVILFTLIMLAQLAILLSVGR